MLCIVLNKLTHISKGDLVEIQNFDHLPAGKSCIFKTTSSDLTALKEIAVKKPEYIDIDHTIPLSTLQAFQEEVPDQKIILSYHDFEKTPEDLQALYDNLRQKPATLYKIATFANSSVDTLRLLELVYLSEQKLIGIPMGPLGSPGRVLGPVIGNPIDYAPISEEEINAPGQIPMGILLNKYHYEKLSLTTKIYGLIGDPVAQSLGERVHNPLMEKLDLDGVYLSFKVDKEEIYPFLKYAMRLPFKGLSVTMPLKEMLGPEPVNTLIFWPNRLETENTDGKAMLTCLGDVNRKHVVIIGAGGAAKAIYKELKKNGADITLLNRSVDKAKAIDPHAKSLSDVPEKYDILINCTPAPLPIDPEKLIPHSLVIDIKTMMPLPLLEEAAKRGCRTLSGHAMYLEQALEQLKHWFPNSISPKQLRTTLEKELAVYS